MSDDLTLEEGVRDTNVLPKSLSWLVTILVPVALVMTAVRLLMTPAFLQIEYNMPGFPEDNYGFTKQERLHWSNIALDYLLNSQGISFLGDLRFADGQPVYNQRELHHMVDVKRTVQAALLVWYVSLLVLIALGLWAWRGDWLQTYRDGLARGGWLTVLLVGTIILFVAISFSVFFVAFHNVFFKPGTWTFLYSDTLIRLFPERFWRDIFIYVGVLSVGGGLGLALGLRRRRA
jgi:integral membrane protein (TIGR01906 family)